MTLRWLDRADADGFMRLHHREAIIVEAEPGLLLDRLSAHPGYTRRGYGHG